MRKLTGPGRSVVTVTAAVLILSLCPGRADASATPDSGARAAEAGPPAVLVVIAGDEQSAPIGSPFISPLVVAVYDRNGIPLPGEEVTFRRLSSLMTFGDDRVDVGINTDSLGVSETPSLRAGAEEGEVEVEASVAGLDARVTYHLTVSGPEDPPIASAPQTLMPSSTKVLHDGDVLGSDGGGILQLSASLTVAPGDVLVSGPTATLPNGLLRRVVAVDVTADGIVATTASTPLASALPAYNFAAAVPIATTPSSVDGSGQQKFEESIKQEWEVCNGTPLLAEKCAKVPGKDLKKIGTVSLKEVLSGQVEVGASCSLTLKCKAHAVASATYEKSFDVEVLQAIERKYSKELAQFDAPRIKFAISGVPVTILPRFTLTFDADFRIEAAMTVHASETMTAELGIDYDDGDVSPINTFEHVTEPLTIKASVSASAGAQLTAKLQFLFYDAAGPYVALSGRLQFDAKVPADPWWTLKFLLNASAGFDFSGVPVLGSKLPKINLPLYDDEWLLGQSQSSPVAITSEPPEEPDQGELFHHQFTAAGGTTPYTWSIPLDQTPPGLTLEPSTGELSGPLGEGFHDFSVVVEDASGSRDQRYYQLANPLSSPYRDLVSALAPTVYYHLDEPGGTKATNSGVDKGSDGTYEGAPGFRAGGAILGEGALAVDLSQGSMSAPAKVLPAGNQPRTVEFWVLPSASQRLITYGTNFTIDITDNTVVVNGLGFSSSYGLLGEWHLIDVRYDGTKLSVYVDGMDLGKQTATLNTVTDDAMLTLGPASARYDEVAVMKSAVSVKGIRERTLVAIDPSADCSAPVDDYGELVNASKPSGYWRLDDQRRIAVDSSGNCQNGLYSSDDTPRRPSGAVDSSGAVDLNGETVVLPADDLPSGRQARTVEFWMNPTEYSDALRSVLTYGKGLAVDYNNSRTFRVYNDSDSVDFITPTELVGGWHLVTLTASGTNVGMFLDGQSLGVQKLKTRTDNSTAVVIGSGQGGSYDEVAIYPEMLSEQTIVRHYTQPLIDRGYCASQPSGNYAKQILGDEPRVFYRFSNEVGPLMDSSGNCRNASASGGATTSNSGALNGEISGEGSLALAAGVMSASANRLPAGADPRTVEFWMNPTEYSDALRSVLTYGKGLAVDYNNSRTFRVYNDSDSVDFITPTELVGGWHLVTLTASGTEIGMFLDGQSLGVQALPIDTDNRSSLVLGGTLNGSGQGGGYDELAVYPEVLTSAQIARHFTAGGAPTAQCLNETTAYGRAIGLDHPTIHMPLDDQSAVAHDAAGACHNGAYAGGGTPVPGATFDDPTTKLPDEAGAHLHGQVVSANADPAPAGADPRTVEFWMNPTEYSDAFRSVLTYGKGLAVDYNNSRTFRVYNDSDSVDFITPTELVGGWHLVTLTASGTEIGMFLDGQSLGVQALPIDTDNRSSLVLGGTLNGSGQGGGYDELAVYPEVLTSAQIARHFTAAEAPDLLCATPPTSGYGRVILDDGPSLYYQLGDDTRTAYDVAGDCHNGSSSLGASRNVSGARAGDGAIALSGQVVSANADPAPAGADPRTVEFWMNPTEYSDAFRSVLTYGKGLAVDYNNSRTFRVYNDSDSVDFITPTELVGGWHLVTLTASGTEIGMFLDGQSLGVQALPIDTDNRSSLVLGGTLNGSGQGGGYDELAVYPEVLTSAQIARHFTAAEAPDLLCATPPTSGYGRVILDDGPSLYYQLGDDTRTAYDVAGDCHNGSSSLGASRNVSGARAGDGAIALSGQVVSANADPAPAGADPRTVEFWMNPTEYSDAFRSVLTYGKGLAVDYNNSRTFRVYNDSDSVDFITPTELVGGWHLVTLTASGTEIGMFLDGQSLGVQALPIDTDNRSSLVLGGTLNGSGQGGGYDELAVYPEVLTSAQIARHFTAAEAPDLLCATPPTSGYGRVILDDGPSLYYQLGDDTRTAYDVAGDCHNGSSSLGASRNVSGARAGDGAIALSGQVVSANADPAPAGADPRTVEFWMNPTEYSDAFRSVLTYGKGLAVDYNNSRTFRVYNDSDSVDFITPTELVGGWHLVTLTASGTEIGMFLDGQSLGVQALPIDTDNRSSLVLGGTLNGSGQGGGYDELAVYPEVLTSAQIARHFSLPAAPQ